MVSCLIGCSEVSWLAGDVQDPEDTPEERAGAQGSDPAVPGRQGREHPAPRPRPALRHGE